MSKPTNYTVRPGEYIIGYQFSINTHDYGFGSIIVTVNGTSEFAKFMEDTKRFILEQVNANPNVQGKVPPEQLVILAVSRVAY